MSWQVRKLGEFISIKHGWAFKGEHFSDSGKYIVLTPGNAYETGGLKLRPGKEKFYLGDFPTDYLMKTGDMLVVMTDLIQAAPILGGAIVITEDDRYLHNQRLGLVELLPGAAIDDKFLYYLLNSPAYRAQVKGTATGATVRHTAPKRICECSVLIPETTVMQKQVAEVLSAYDDLIEINRRRIALLEESARLLYREWFVHLRFPGYDLVKCVNGLPVGWERKQLSAMVEINPKTPFEKEKPFPFVPMQSLSESTMLLHAPEMRPISGGAKFQNGDTLLARITPCLENGKTGFVQFLNADVPVASGSTEFIVLRSKCVNPYWVYCLAREEAFRSHAIASMSGADGRQRVNIQCFDSYEVLQPPNAVLEDFAAHVEPCFKQIQGLSQMNYRLQETRDALLPKLMSGEIAV